MIRTVLETNGYILRSPILNCIKKPSRVSLHDKRANKDVKRYEFCMKNQSNASVAILRHVPNCKIRKVIIRKQKGILFSVERLR
jgi:hypothetical protein